MRPMAAQCDSSKESRFESGSSRHFSRRVGQGRAKEWWARANHVFASYIVSFHLYSPSDRRPTIATVCLSHPTPSSQEICEPIRYQVKFNPAYPEIPGVAKAKTSS